MSNFFNYKINESIKYKTYYKPNYHEFEIIIPSPQMIKLNGMPVSTNWLILKKVENEQLYDNPTIYCDNNLFIEYTDITKLKDMPENQYFIFYEFGIIYFHKNFVLLKFNNINDINECLEYKGLDIYSERFEDEKVYITDLIDFDAYDEEDNLIGSVVDYLEVPQGYILELKTKEGQKVLVPYVDEFITEIDFENQEIIIHLIEGMLWE